MRLGSYSIALTVAGMPSFWRLKSMMRYLRRAPPPWWRTVILPWLLRPARWRRSVVRDFSGVFLVISSNVRTDMKRRAGEVGLYTRMAITWVLPF